VAWRGVAWRGVVNLVSASRYLRARLLLALCLGLLPAPLTVLAWSLPVSPNPEPGIGQPIGSWYFHPTVLFDGLNPYHFVSVNSANVADFMQYGFAFVANAGGALTSEGVYDGHVILSTAHYKNHGLGFILQYRTWQDGNTNAFTPVTSMDTVFPVQWLGLSTSAINRINLGQTVQLTLNVEIRIHWIRLTGLDTSGTNLPIVSSSVNTRIFNVRLASNHNGPKLISGQPVLSNYWRQHHVYNAPVATCTTPSFPMKTVNFGTIVESEFTHVGATPVARPLELTFSNCPQGYNKIGYYFKPPSAGLEAGHPGVIKLDPSSQAQGFGVRILDENNIPIAFFAGDSNPDTINTYWLGNYINPGECRLTDPNCGFPWNPGVLPRNDYTVHLTAQLYQTETTVTPGKFRASLILVMQYK